MQTDTSGLRVMVDLTRSSGRAGSRVATVSTSSNALTSASRESHESALLTWTRPTRTETR